MFLYVYELNYVKNTPVQSKIEITAHVIKISSQIVVFADLFAIYFVENSKRRRSGTALCVLPPKMRRTYQYVSLLKYFI